MGKLDGKVAFITGVARGQGRSHAVRLAQEGASIVGVDLCRQIDSVIYPMATEADLAETVKLVEQAGGKLIAEQGDVRDYATVERVIARGVDELGRLDIALANAGIMPVLGDEAHELSAWHDAIDVMLTGVMYTFHLASKAIIDSGEGGSMVVTSSTAGMKGMTEGDFGSLGYGAAKWGVVGLMKGYANHLAPHMIRVNSVHPTGCNTPMVANEAFGAHAAANPHTAQMMANPMPVPMVEPVDVSNAIAWLCSDDARYVTGLTLPVDAGFVNRP